MKPISKMLKRQQIIGAVALLFSPSLSAQILIQVGSNSLLPDTANQSIDFFMTGQSPSAYNFQGFEFNMQVGDGGAAAGGTSVGPRITGVDLVAGTLFENNNLGTQDASGQPQNQHPLLAFYSTITLSDTVTLLPGATPSIARVTFDTTGLNSGNWTLALGLTVNGPTKFVNLAIPGHDGNGNIFPTITDGSLAITAVPEPMMAPLVGALLLGFVAWRRRFRGIA